ncbi:MAG: NifU N-terminal domain-containing protein [Candidatus Paceibacterota bacterium]
MKVMIEEKYNDENRLVFHIDVEIPEKLSIDDFNSSATSEATMFKWESGETYHFMTTLLSIKGVGGVERSDDKVVIRKDDRFRWKDLIEDILHVLKSLLAKPGESFEVSPYNFY